jgi:C1A family cysteine protease
MDNFKLIPLEYMKYDKYILENATNMDDRMRSLTVKKLSELPAQKMLKITPVKNQGGIGSCTGFGLVGCLDTLIAEKFNASENLSEIFCYWNNKKYDPWPGSEYSGSSVTTAAQLSVTNGVCHENVAPYVEKEVGEITSKMYTDASKRKATAITYLQNKAEWILSALAEGRPICIGIDVTPGFNNPNKGYVTSNGASQGGHCMAATGYFVQDGHYWVVIKNSWGTSWGDKGLCYYRMDKFLEVLQTAISIDGIVDSYKLGYTPAVEDKKLVKKCSTVWYAPWKKKCWYEEVAE